MHRALLWLLVLSLATTACQGQAHEVAEQAPEAALPGVSSTLTQYREGLPRRIVRVKVDNQGPVPLPFKQLQLDSPAFARVEASANDARLDPGRRVDLAVRYGAARCDGDLPPTGEPAALVRVRAGDGPVQDVRLPVPSD